MFFIVSTYFIALVLIFLVIYKLKNKTHPLPNLVLTKCGLIFNSYKRHKIFVGDVKLMQIENCVYLKKGVNTIAIKNVNSICLNNGYLYFNALGKVKILFNCKSYYRLFNINIKSAQFDLYSLKQQALIQLVNNLFDVNNCTLVKRYINAVKSILNISADSNKLEVKQNKYLLPFTITYKIKNTLKVVNINQKLGKL